MEKSNILQIKNSHQSELYLCFCGNSKCEANHSYGPGIRDNYIIHYIIEGEGKYYVNNTCYSLVAGEGFLIEPNTQVFYQANNKNPWKYLWIGFNGTKATEYLKSLDLDSTHLTFKSSYKQELIYLVEKMLKNNKMSLPNQFLLKSLLYEFFSILSRDLKTLVSPKSNDNIYVNKAIEFIENNFSNNIKITDIARFVCITRNYLYILFRKYLNCSPQEYLINYRITYAEKLLKNTNLSIEVISNSCGYQEALVFSKIFKSKKGITPTQFRNKKNNI